MKVLVEFDIDTDDFKGSEVERDFAIGNMFREIARRIDHNAELVDSNRLVISDSSGDVIGFTLLVK